MQKTEFICPVKAGKIPHRISLNVGKTFKGMEGKTIRISIEENKRKRSIPQNSFYWSAVIPAIKDMFFEAGQLVDEQIVHEYLKRYVGNLTRPIATPDGKTQVVTRSSTELSTMDWEIFIEQIRAFAAQWDVKVPFPHEHTIQGKTNVEV